MPYSYLVILKKEFKLLHLFFICFTVCDFVVVVVVVFSVFKTHKLPLFDTWFDQISMSDFHRNCFEK